MDNASRLLLIKEEKVNTREEVSLNGVVSQLSFLSLDQKTPAAVNAQPPGLKS